MDIVKTEKEEATKPTNEATKTRVTNMPVTGTPMNRGRTTQISKRNTISRKQKRNNAATTHSKSRTGKEVIVTGTIGWTPIESATQKGATKKGASLGVKWVSVVETVTQK